MESGGEKADEEQDDTLFAVFRFRGARFDDASDSIPLELGGELSAYRNLVVEIAKALYREAHPTRKRLPRGFARSIDLRISRTSPGSLVIDIVDRTSHPKLPVYDEVAEARRLIEEVFGDPTSLPEAFPSSARSALLRFGATLWEDDEVVLSHPGSRAITYDRDTRSTLVATVRDYVEEQYSEIVKVTQIDAERNLVTLSPYRGNETVTARFDPDEWFDVLKGAVNPSPAADRWLIEGLLRRHRDGRSMMVTSIENATNVEGQLRTYDRALDQLRELSELTDGWLDGTSDAPTAEVRESVARVLEALEQTSLDAPMLSPLTDGGVHLEWQDDGQVSYIDLENDGTIDVIARYDGVNPEYRDFESVERLIQDLGDLDGLV